MRIFTRLDPAVDSSVVYISIFVAKAGKRVTVGTALRQTRVS